jgi:hypothetical protein
MRMTQALLFSGILLLVFSLCSFLYAVIDPDRGHSIHGLILFGTPMFPAMMGLVLIVAGYATAFLNRMSWNSHQLA